MICPSPLWSYGGENKPLLSPSLYPFSSRLSFHQTDPTHYMDISKLIVTRALEPSHVKAYSGFVGGTWRKRKKKYTYKEKGNLKLKINKGNKSTMIIDEYWESYLMQLHGFSRIIILQAWEENTNEVTHSQKLVTQAQTKPGSKKFRQRTS